MKKSGNDNNMKKVAFVGRGMVNDSRLAFSMQRGLSLIEFCS